MRVVGLVSGGVRLGNVALDLVALDQLGRSLLGGGCCRRYQYYLWSYLWSAWAGAVVRPLVGAVNLTVSESDDVLGW